VPELRLENSIVDERYQVDRCLSHGSYAEIFIARDLAQNGLQIIIKALNAFLQGTPDPDLERTLIQNFQNEAIALDKVCHPNIIRRLGHGTASDLEQTPFHYLVLEYMPGGDLLSLCRQRPLDLAQTISYFEQVSSALSFAHSQQVIHRDVKPNNLLLSGDRAIVKIADFGVAKIAASEADEITRVGTNLYAPPEHHPDSQTCDLRQSLTPSADVYSMAKTILTAMTGRSPHQFIREPISSLPTELAGQPWGSSLLAILSKATSTEVESRYQSVKEFWDDFSVLGAARMAGASADPEATLVRSRENGQTDPHHIGQPVFHPHVAAIEAGDRARPQKARIVIPLPERAERALGPVSVNPGQAPESGVAQNAPAHILERRPGLVTRNPPAAPAMLTSTRSPAQARVEATKPMVSPVRPGFIERVRRDPRWSAWVRRMFVICMVLTLTGIIAAVYVYFANPDGHGSVVGLIHGSNKDGSIAGAPKINIRSDPDGEAMAELPAGTRIRVLEERNNWARVKILHWEGGPPDDAPDTGWVHRRFIKLD